MEVIGLGTNLVECVRVRSLIERHGELFLRRVYTKHEICVCRSSVRSTEAYAGRWVAKEAVLKSLNVLERAPNRIDVEIRSLGGKPQVVLLGQMLERAVELGVGNVLLSVAVTRKYATATAIAMRV
jgi:holo-[acyl-carrier protein] synthase